MFTVEASIKAFFFDRQRVIDRVSKAEARVLSKAGAFVRRRARSSLRRRKKVSSPGQPPSVHSDDSYATLKNILFGLEPQGDAVLVGPVRLNGSSRLSQAGSPIVPGLLERGGEAQVTEVRVGKQWRTKRRQRNHAGQPERVRTIRYAARPFMNPALKAETKTFPQLFANSVT